MKLLKPALLVLAAAVLAGGGYAWWRYRQEHPVVREVPRQGGLEVTLWTLTDLHFGSNVAGRNAKGGRTWIEAMPVRREMDRQMREVTGKSWPDGIGGPVGAPAALIISGDLTQDGKKSEWEAFAAFYQLGTAEQPPVLECHGNHDEHTGDFVAAQVAARHGGGRCYSTDYGDLHVVSLGAGPDRGDLDWLTHDLAATGRERPVILFMHYPLLGPWSDSWFGWNTAVTERFAELIRGFNVVAILHGHYHVPGRYQWRGFDVYNTGSIQHGARCFGVIRVTDDSFTYASWNAEKNGWWWWHSKPINGAKGRREISASSSSKGLLCAPANPYPVKAAR